MNNRTLFETFLSSNEYEMYIMPKLSHRDLCSLNVINKYCHSIFKTDVLAAKLVNFILIKPTKSNINKLMMYMSHEPASLDMVIMKAQDANGRVIRNKTLFQLAYLSGNSELCHKMKSVIARHLKSEHKAEIYIFRQITSFLKDCADFCMGNQEWNPNLNNLIQSVCAAINAETFLINNESDRFVLNSQTLNAIYHFRKKLNEMIVHAENGAHVCYMTLVQSYEYYVQMATAWNYNLLKCHLYEDGILAPILSFLPANDSYICFSGMERYRQNNPEITGANDRSAMESIKDIVTSESINFLITGAYYDIVAGMKADTTDAAFASQMATARLAVIRKYIEDKYFSFQALLSKEISAKETHSRRNTC